MMDVGQPDQELDVLILAPIGKDAALTQEVLGRAGVRSMVCRDIESLCRGAADAGALLVTEEAIVGEARQQLARLVADQEPWCDLPVLILTRPGADSTTVAEAVAHLGNVTLMERPVRVAALVTTVRSALRSRARQYQLRAHLRERQRAEAALRDAHRRKDEFLAILAHELRNPLAPIRNSLHILRLTGSIDPTVEHVREMMERQVNHMVRLVDDLLEIARFTRGKIELRKERVDLSAVIASAVDASKPLIESADLDLTVMLPPEPLALEADPVRLAQVFSNLLNNAAKFTSPKGHVWLNARREGTHVTVSVRDTGIGIPADMLARVFEMFAQADESYGRVQEGLGVGLALVQTLVQMHGGSVEAHSEGPGRGSEFVVRLPLVADVHTAEAGSHQRQPSTSSVPCRVLVVDDNQDAADSLGILLKFLGMEVHVFHDGLSALQALESHRPAVVLLDIGMPVIDGYEVARRIRRQPQFQDIALIALTGWGQEDDRRRSLAAGFDDHLVKPADAETLQALIRSVTARKADHPSKYRT